MSADHEGRLVDARDLTRYYEEAQGARRGEFLPVQG